MKNLEQKDYEEFSKQWGFDIEDVPQTIKIIWEYPITHSCCTYKQEDLKSIDDFIRMYEGCWYRDYDWDKDIVEYEMGWLDDYKENQGINTREELSEYLKTVDWIYKIKDGLWIEYTA